jgi:hypothetical protein
MAQSTRTKIKNMLGISSSVTTYDDAIDDLLIVSDQIILDDLGLLSFGVTTYVENYSFDFDVSQIGLTYAPMVSVVALTMSGSILIEDTDYFVDHKIGYIELKNKSFDIGQNTMSIEYTAGFDPVPSDITYVTNLVAVSLFNQQSHAGFKNEKAGDYSYQLDNDRAITPMAMRILNKYRRLYARGMKR